MKRGGPIKRKAPLRSSSSLKRGAMKRGKRKPRRGLDHPDYLDFIRRQPCCSCGAKPPSHAHHITGAGMGRKAKDHGETLPLCPQCHRDIHEFRGAFTGMSREDRAQFQLIQAALCLVLHEAQKGRAA